MGSQPRSMNLKLSSTVLEFETMQSTSAISFLWSISPLADSGTRPALRVLPLRD